MSKVKINPGLAAVMLVASLFAGWGTLLMVTVLMLIFCDMEDKVKSVIVRVVSFYIGLTLLSMAWGLIYDGIDLVIDAIAKLVDTINSYLTYPNIIDITKLKAYLFTPVSNIADIANSVIGYLIVFAKFAFIVSIVAGKAAKETFVTKKINEYVAKVVNYINSVDMTNN